MCTMQAANANNYRAHAYKREGFITTPLALHSTALLYVYIPTWPSGPTNINLELKTPPSSPMVSMF